MRRENFVGTTFDIDTTSLDGWPDGLQSVLIKQIAAEDDAAIAFAVVPIAEPDTDPRVVRLFKPTPALEMRTLHNAFTVHGELYPDHPLTMTGEERLAALTEEMLARIDDPRLIFRVGFYRELVEAVITVLAQAFSDPATSPSLDDSPVRDWLDDSVSYHLAKVLGDEGIRPDLRLPLERALDELRDALARWQATRRYAPLSRNPLFMLTGLLFEGFIDIAEYQHISHAPEFVSQVKAAHVGPFFDAITTLFQRIADTKPDVRTAPRLAAGANACTLLFDVSVILPNDANRYAALAKAWQARFLMLAEEPAEVVVPLLKSALEAWQELGDLAQTHDTFILLAIAYQAGNEDAAIHYRNAAQRIRRLLERAD
ncbi:MAG TPA: hypothetical protein VJ914_37735 [Pseudonocardiaceae bacterium]|nr:hypothetical protein [Pseudonocardiaceae bacterium]